MAAKKGSCYRCKHFFKRYELPDDKAEACQPGMCRRYPPRVMNASGKFVSWWPWVEPFWKCGEYDQKDEPGEDE
jgi:hypothetical protein